MPFRMSMRVKRAHRYLSEYGYRCNNRIARGVKGKMRRDESFKGIEGLRLTYRRTCGAALS